MADNNENKVLNVPHLRFPEFSGEWNKYTINDLATVVGGGTPDTTVKSYWGGDIQWFTPSEIGKNKYVDFSKRTITRDGLDNSSAKLLPLHTILLSSRATVGECSIASNECTTNQGFQSLIAKQCNIDFLYYLIQTKKKDLIRNACGSTFLEISANEIRKIKVAVPVQNEQEQIAKLLSLIDERIATQNKIIEDLKKLKSAISKYLFARKDLLETTICLSNIATLKNGYAFQSGKYNALGKWKILTITNVPGERYINDEDCNCIINLPNDIQDHQVLKEGDILISLTGNVGRVSLCKNGNYLLNQRVGLLQLAKNVNQEFLYQILSSQRFENSMIACGQGAAQMNIGKGDVENYVLPYSSNGNNILFAAKILHSYDECIINELRRLTLLTMQKQYLLTQMFI
ncbi:MULTISPECIES: restriction endonuclease subunit S [Bacteroidales]|nr:MULTISPECIES: restriction endonuclease subunit S [Bacteroidaceae]MCE9344428.1 restriction endonuclease subunit S [Bacteroides fragilis]MCL0358111.1 restriction endonuclease subunit S [Bacteroides fragilis]MCL0416338.1 restriction endonuclease subunit S [Bacteroides fragilis]MCO5742225.1 restriction endonuclease subunit S [Bacteroides fragilis]MCP8446824.1 restriction endonuclease subunit S [Bacteroides fragilis]